MSSCKIVKLNKFIIDISSKKVSAQFDELKKLIDLAITFFNTSYIDTDEHDNSNSNDILRAKYFDGYDRMISNGYEHVAKINAILNLLMIADESQTNKFKYEESKNCFINSVEFQNIFNEMGISLFDKQIEKCLDEAKINNNKNTANNNENTINNNEKIIKVSDINVLHNKRETFELNEKINIFNHYINTIILQLCEVKLILKNTNVK